MGGYILGLDLSMASTGVVVYEVESGKVIEIRTIKTNSKQSTPERLYKIWNELNIIKTNYVVNKVYIERAFTRFNKATQQLYRVHGITNLLFYDIEQVYLAPTTIKKQITGKGNANKKQVRNVMEQIYPYVDIANEDESDALAILHCGLKG